MKLSLSTFLPSKPSTALVIRPGVVELLCMKGRTSTTRVRVPVKELTSEGLAEAVRSTVAASGRDGRRVAVSIQSPELLIRFFKLPMIPRGEWETAAQFEARKYVPFKVDDLVWDCYVAQGSASSSARPAAAGESPQQLDVVFAAMLRDAFQQLQRALTTAGVQATVVEPLSVSLARLAFLTEKDAAAHDFMCLVDVEDHRVHLVIARAGMPYLTRDIHVAVAAAPEGESIAPVQVQQVLSELRVSMDFFLREYPAAHISKVVLFGDDLEAGAWVRVLSGQLSCPVELGSPMISAQVDGELSLTFAAAVGLLGLGVGRGGPTINLLKLKSRTPQPIAPSKPASMFALPNLQVPWLAALLRQRPAVMVPGLVAAIVPMVISAWLGSHQVAVAQQQLTALLRSQRPVGIGLDGLDAAGLEDVRQHAAQQLAFLKQAVDGRVSMAQKLDALARTLPEGVWLTGLAFDGALDLSTGTSRPELTVSGACYLGGGDKELHAIQAFEEEIKRNAALFTGFESAQVGQVNTATDAQQVYTYRTFQLSCLSRRL